MIEATDKEIAALQAFEDAYDQYWGWSADGPIDPKHAVQQAPLIAIKAAYPHLLGIAYAQAGEAGTAATPKSDAVHEHAVVADDAPNPSLSSSPRENKQ